MELLFWLFVLGLVGYVAWDITTAPTRFCYPYSKTGKPYVERDKDGYLTDESYRSHIKLYGDGTIEADVWALTQTKSFADAIEFSKKLNLKQAGLHIENGKVVYYD